VNEASGIILITADHGNCEQMLNHETGQPHTSHTTNPVPFILAGSGANYCTLENGSLCDIAPTILDIMGIDIPIEMTGRSLINGSK
jgi:2,3-bisphosphoglycerate-independent phosphoglycerate mutase